MKIGDFREEVQHRRLQESWATHDAQFMQAIEEVATELTDGQDPDFVDLVIHAARPPEGETKPSGFEALEMLSSRYAGSYQTVFERMAEIAEKAEKSTPLPLAKRVREYGEVALDHFFPKAS